MERETLEVDVLVVGAGPAGLCFAIDLARRAEAAGEELAILVLDKAEELGRHQLSGAVLDPRAILEMDPLAAENGFPIQAKVKDDALLWFREKGHNTLRGLTCPPQFKNHGNWIVSAAEVVEWLAAKAEEAGVEVYPGFGAASLIEEDGAVRGVVTVDQGRDRHGAEKSTFQPGMEIRARLTVVAEGTRGSLAKKLIASHDLARDRNPQIWGVGIKEIWEVEEDLEGTVYHTGGWPLDRSVYGGGWIYGLPGKRVSIGFVMGMDHGDPNFDYHARMQEWKTHPFMRKLLEGGKMVRYGAKTVPEGGLFSLPRCWGEGFLMIGDSAGFMNTARLKGVHLAMKSGLLGAEAALGALQGHVEGAKAEALSAFDHLFEASWAHEELHKVRNFRQGFQKGFLRGSMAAGMVTLSGGRFPGGRKPLESDHDRYRKSTEVAPKPVFDGKLTFDKLTDVYHSGTVHEEDQPCHLVVLEPDICTSRCTTEYGNPCQHFCPASVYEWEEGGLKINASNCVHCKTCDIADPYQIIDWVVPEGGGPVYTGM
jgi:electron-transferring-flavoprotein dehydrogenase